MFRPDTRPNPGSVKRAARERSRCVRAVRLAPHIAGFIGDGRPAGQAQLQFPAGLVFTAEGALLIGDSCNHRVRRIK
jgi:hypothetical protein